ncbi:MAG: hypothetical protein O6829_10295, partial [Alphaproteobacteria bacterium]|nr:hypothetical protein [Alphaproteobacteria bacterium]
MSAPPDPVGTQLAFFAPPARPAPPESGETKAQAPADGFATWLFGADGFNFLDILDVINPLQHIPFVSTLYRALTGDTIAPASRVAGGALFGGPIGAAVSLVNSIVAEWSGKDISDHVVAFFTGVDSDDDARQMAGDLPETETAGGAPNQTPGQAAELAAAGHWAAPAPPAAALGVVPAGAGTGGDLAGPGGWHSDVMLAALAKYEQSAQLARA